MLASSPKHFVFSAPIDLIDKGLHRVFVLINDGNLEIDEHGYDSSFANSPREIRASRINCAVC
jgi:hypothetical protein